jgi:3-deoxy-D-manno-octulosonic-acid transferase
MLLCWPLVALYLLQRYVSGKSRPGWWERWGRLPEAVRWQSGGRPRIWIHAVSAGEVVAAVPILRELRARLPEYDLLLSVITPNGHQMAREQAARYVDAIFYFPFDLPGVTQRVVRAIRPQVFASLESELWPNILHALKQQDVATIMVNGRISDGNFRRVRRYDRWLFRWMLGNMDRLLMQSEADAERIRILSGLSAESERVGVIGNSKFDQEITRLSPEQTLALRRDLKLPDDAPVFVAGSTRSTEEDAQVIAAYQAMLGPHPDLCLLIAPRHIDRAEQIVTAMRTAGLSPVLRTQASTASAPVRHLVLNTLGELANVYAVAAFAFIGNTFEPVVKGGGQNLLQPLAHGKPVFFGPRIATIRSEVALVLAAGVGFQVTDWKTLAAGGLRLLSEDAQLGEIESHALALIAANRGVSAKYAEAVAEMARGNVLPFDLRATEVAATKAQSPPTRTRHLVGAGRLPSPLSCSWGWGFAFVAAVSTARRKQ